MKLTGTKKNKSLWFDIEGDCLCHFELTKKDKVSGKYLHFDSLGEYQLYRLLKSIPNVEVKRGVRIALLPPLEHLPAVTWNIDFELRFESQNKKKTVLLEYKGGYIKSDNQAKELFCLKYRLLERTIPENTSFILVMESAFSPCKGLNSMTPHQALTHVLKGITKDALA